MLIFNVDLVRKPTDFYLHTCQIEKIIELSEKEFDDLVTHPYKDRGFIAENADLMCSRNNEYFCLLVLGENRGDGVLIESEGAAYVRYGAYVSHARDYVEREMEQLVDFFMKDLSPDPETGSRSIYLGDIEEYTGATVTGDSEIARMFYRILKDRSDVADVEVIGDCMVVMPAVNQSFENYPHMEALDRKVSMLERALDTLSEHFRGQDLYDVLHDSMGMSNAEITAEGFDLDEYMISEEPENTPEITM